MSTADFTIYCDGGSRGNPGHAAIGFVVYNSRRQILAQNGRYLGITTNNVAEYQSAIAALTWLITSPLLQKIRSQASLPIKIQIFMDSQLVVNQLTGKYKITKSHLKDLSFQIHQLISQHKLIVNFIYTPRDKNQLADSEVNRALDAKLR